MGGLLSVSDLVSRCHCFLVTGSCSQLHWSASHVSNVWGFDKYSGCFPSNGWDICRGGTICLLTSLVLIETSHFDWSTIFRKSILSDVGGS